MARVCLIAMTAKVVPSTATNRQKKSPPYKPKSRKALPSLKTSSATPAIDKLPKNTRRRRLDGGVTMIFPRCTLR